MRCPYCKKLANFYSFINYNQSVKVKCKNHQLTSVYILYNNANIQSIELISYEYTINISYLDNIMTLRKNMDYKPLCELLIDNSLTPENFEEKLNFYLMFL